MAFLRLIRPINLSIIALTMLSVRMIFALLYHESEMSMRQHIDFGLLIFSTVLIAAAGNIINDYFDVKADRINRPDRLIITKSIKPRWAIISHWILNIVAFIIAIYLSVRENTFWYVFIDLLSINLLWFYSMYFKRKPFIGNFIIALLTALVPFLAGIYLDTHSHGTDALFYQSLLCVTAFAGFAFCLNLSREIIKDIEDVTGDLALKATTLPILRGIPFSVVIASLPLLAISCTYLCVYIFFQNDVVQLSNFRVFWPLHFAVFLSLMVAFWMLFHIKNAQRIIQVEIFLKIIMLIGVLFPFYCYFLK